MEEPEPHQEEKWMQKIEVTSVNTLEITALIEF